MSMSEIEEEIVRRVAVSFDVPVALLTPPDRRRGLQSGRLGSLPGAGTGEGVLSKGRRLAIRPNTSQSPSSPSGRVTPPDLDGRPSDPQCSTE